jgi:hypothetical protein
MSSPRAIFSPHALTVKGHTWANMNVNKTLVFRTRPYGLAATTRDVEGLKYVNQRSL